MKPTFYLTQYVRYENKALLYCAMARARSISNQEMLVIREPEPTRGRGIYKKEINHQLNPEINFYLAQVHYKHVKSTMANCVDLLEVEPSSDSIEGLLSYVFNRTDEYLLSEWFLPDVEDVISRGSRKNRMYETKNEMGGRLDLIKDAADRTKSGLEIKFLCQKQKLKMEMM